MAIRIVTLGAIYPQKNTRSNVGKKIYSTLFRTFSVFNLKSRLVGYENLLTLHFSTGKMQERLYLNESKILNSAKKQC